MKILVATADQPTANHRIYPRAVIEKAMAGMQKRVEDKTAFIYRGEPTFSNVIGIVDKVFLDGNNLVAEVTPYNFTEGKGSDFDLSSCAYGAVGRGKVDADGKVSDYRIEYIAVRQLVNRADKQP